MGSTDKSFSNTRHLLQRCLDAVRNVWTIESNVLFESRSGLHKLGFRVLQFTTTVANVSPDVFAARRQCSPSTTQVQHVDQLLYQPWIRLPGESVAAPVDDTLEHCSCASATGSNPPDSLGLHEILEDLLEGIQLPFFRNSNETVPVHDGVNVSLWMMIRVRDNGKLFSNCIRQHFSNKFPKHLLAIRVPWSRRHWSPNYSRKLRLSRVCT